MTGMTGIAALATAADPQRTYLEDARTGHTRTFGDVAAAVDGVTSALAGRPEAARVALDVDDPLEFTLTFLGIVASGRLVAPLDPGAPAADAHRAVSALRCDLVVSDRPDDERWAATPTVHVATVLRPTGAVDHPVSASGPAGVLLRTSGSTGEPKIVRLREAQLLSVAQAVARSLQLRPGERGYNPLPLFHVNAEVVGVLASLVAGSTLVLDRRFRRTGFWSLIDEREITWINAVPTILGILARDLPDSAPPALRVIRSASAPLPPDVRRRVQETLRVPVVESWGMTEAGSQITSGAVDGSTPFGSVGLPAGTEVTVRDAAAGGVGRLWIRGPGVVAGYEGGRAADRFDDAGWLDTGDDGRVGDDGEIYLVGRADDQINRGGELIYPREVEDVLRADERVADVAVVGMPDETLGEVPVAFVTRRGSAPAADDSFVADLADLAARSLSRFKVPARITVVDTLPRTATGKIERSALVAAGASRPDR